MCYEFSGIQRWQEYWNYFSKNLRSTLELRFNNSNNNRMVRGRPKQFDENTALEAAMQVFWQRGYEEASCDELLAAMQINSGSMYATFGDKKSLFERAFALYADRIFSRGATVLDGPGSPLANVRNLVRAWGEFMSQPNCRGCLVAQAMIEFGHTDSNVGTEAKALVRRFQDKLEATLVAAKEAGELDPQSEPKEIAAFLINTVQGLSVMARSGAGEAAVAGVINTTLFVLK